MITIRDTSGFYFIAICNIYICNSQGIITKIKPYEKGWDGYNSNGDKLPSSDYWFMVKYNKNNVLREFRANFSLLRR